MRVAGDQRFVVRKRHSWNIFEQVFTVAYLKKKNNQISLETNYVEVSFLIKLHARGPETFLRKQLIALYMVLNTPLSQKLSTYNYNPDACKDPNDYRSSRSKVFCKKGALEISHNNSQENTCARASFLIKLQASDLQLYFKK